MNNETKLKYEQPQMEIVAFESDDIIITSAGFLGEFDGLYSEQN